MKADLRISIKDYSRNKNLEIQLTRHPFAAGRQFWVKMNEAPWLKDDRPVSLTKLLTALRKSLVKSFGGCKNQPPAWLAAVRAAISSRCG